MNSTMEEIAESAKRLNAYYTFMSANYPARYALQFDDIAEGQDLISIYHALNRAWQWAKNNNHGQRHHPHACQ